MPRARASECDFCELWVEAAVKPINAWPLIILLVAVLFMMAWFGGYLA